MSKPKFVVSTHETNLASYRSYVSGFILSLILTLTAYIIVTHKGTASKWGLAIIIAVLALIQFIVQLTLFLHLGNESKPRFKLLVFGFMLSVVLILIGGSIWIMYNLNYRMMTPNQINTYMNNQDGGL